MEKTVLKAKEIVLKPDISGIFERRRQIRKRLEEIKAEMDIEKACRQLLKIRSNLLDACPTSPRVVRF